jgi:uncharacterized protein (UPF0548 family)
MRVVQPASKTSVERILTTAKASESTFPNLGASLTNSLPDGYRQITRSTRLGTGIEVFKRASEGIRGWRAHDLPGLRVFPVATPPHTGGTVVVTMGTKYVSIAAPCRIFDVIDEPTRFGFVYATLPGHPERGEEAFIVSMNNDGEVRFQITAISTPADRLTRITGPFGRAVQSIATSGYLRSMRRYVRQSTS